MAAWMLLSVCLAPSPAPTFFGDEIDRQVDLVVQRRSACGPTAAWYCLQRLGYEVSLEEAIRSAGLTEKGISLESLFGLAPSTEPKALAGRPEDVEDLPKPCILILENHCVALVVLAGLVVSSPGIWLVFFRSPAR